MSIETHTFTISGMHCGSCSALIDETLIDLPGVSAATTTLDPARAVVDLNPAQTTPAQVAAAIVDLGYEASPVA
jgi:copper chaperone